MKKLVFTLVVIFFFVESHSQPNYGFLRRDGKEIINDDGPVLLKGLALGNWIVTESYMWGLDDEKFDAPTNFQNELLDLLGSEDNLDYFLHEWRSNFITEADIEAIANLGFNSIRVPFHYNQVYDIEKEQFNDKLFQYIDNLVTWCSEHKLYIILDMHCAVGAQSEKGHADYLGDNFLWDNYEYYKPLNAKVWKHIADHYKNEPWIGGYDLINETVLDEEKWKLRDLYVAITNSIRVVDNNHLIFAEGNYYGTDLWNLSSRWDDNMAFSIHNYWSEIPKPGILGIENQVQLADTANVPLWLGETGENSNHWLNAHIRDCEGRNIGWSVWTYKKFESMSGAYIMQYPEHYQILRDYWQNAGPRPNAGDALSYLLELVNSTRFENCTENKDVTDALLRPEFHTASVPFSDHTIPGKIDAVNYDMGANGIAYSDSIYQTVSTDPFTDWNSGFIYRNDGTDITKCSDPESNGFNVFETSTNEWMNYTVNIDQSGIYSLEASVAGEFPERTFHVLIDDIDVTGLITVQSTGGPQNWQSVLVNNINLTQGEHMLKVVFDNAGLNIGYLRIYPTVDVTFQVDATGLTVSPEGLHIAGNFFQPYHWKTDGIELSPVGGNIYTVTLNLPQNKLIEYKFFNGNTPGDAETVPEASRNQNFNREFIVPDANTTLPPVSLLFDPVPMVNVTFRVDAQNIWISEEGIHLAGNFDNQNYWAPDGIQLEHEGNDIYSYTLSLPVGKEIEYKYINGLSWNNSEVLPDACSNENNNRYFTVPGSDYTLPAYAFGTCELLDSGTYNKVDVTFRVDMSATDIWGGGMHLTGNFKDPYYWRPDVIPMKYEGDGIYSETRKLIIGEEIQYRFIRGTWWNGLEKVPEECMNADSNRFLTVPDRDTVLPAIGFGSCDVPEKVNVTFKVDMSTTDIWEGGIHLTGNFNEPYNWKPDSIEMQHEGNGIYSVTENLAKGKEVQYKFIRGTWWNGLEKVPEECMNADSNRYFTVPEYDIVLPAVGYGSCNEIPKYNITFSVDMSDETVSSDGVYIAGNFPGVFWDASAISLTHAGDNIYSVTLSLPQKLYKYKFLNGSEWEDVTSYCGIENPDMSGINDRAYLATTEPDQTVITPPFGGCATIDVTFRVDMTGQDLAAGGPHIAGGFPGANWDASAFGLTHEGDSIYSVDIPLTPGYYTYKFLRGNYWGTEETVPAECGVEGGTAGVYDRYIDVTGTQDIVLDIVSFGSCEYLSDIFEIHLDVPYVEEDLFEYSGAACAKMILDYQADNTFTQHAIQQYGTASNYSTNSGADFIDPYGMYRSLNHFELNSNYNYAELKKNTIEEAYRDICYWISYEIPGTPREHLPSAVPVYGNFNDWFVINGFQSSANPHEESDYTVYGFYVSDPRSGGVGHNMFIQANTFGTYYFYPISSSDIWDGKYVSVNEPPASSGTITVEPERVSIEPVDNETRFQTVEYALDNYNLSDNHAVQNVSADGIQRDRIYFVDMEGTIHDYYIVTYSRHEEGDCIIAGIIDANNGALKLLAYNEPDYDYYRYLDNLTDTFRLKTVTDNSISNELLYPVKGIISSTANIDIIPDDESFAIYPNPAKDFLTISTHITGEKMLKVMNVSGQIIYRETMDEYTKELDVAGLEKGIYLVTMQGDSFIATLKFIKD